MIRMNQPSVNRKREQLRTSQIPKAEACRDTNTKPTWTRNLHMHYVQSHIQVYGCMRFVPAAQVYGVRCTIAHCCACSLLRFYVCVSWHKWFPMHTIDISSGYKSHTPVHGSRHGILYEPIRRYVYSKRTTTIVIYNYYRIKLIMLLTNLFRLFFLPVFHLYSWNGLSRRRVSLYVFGI